MRKINRFIKSNACNIAIVALLSFDVVFISTGCVKLKPGADPIVVRAEQAEAGAKATFDLVLKTDQIDRGYWRTNAPAFHNFCEWLRQPQPVWGTNYLPRASAMIANLDNVKQDYKAARGSSNAVITALITLQSAVTEASAWSAVVTNRPAR
jgi:hypothetical protein